MADIRVKSGVAWKPQADAEAQRCIELAQAGMAYDITFYCNTREEAASVDEYMSARYREAAWSTVVSQNPHEMDDDASA